MNRSKLRVTVLGLILALSGACSLSSAQPPTKRIFLSPKSNIPTADIADGLAKNCSNVVLTENQKKADYELEAAETVSVDEGTTSRHWHFTLMSMDGDVLMTTQPEFHLRSKFAHHFKAVCKFINKAK